MIIEAREDTITLRGTVKSNIWPAIQAAAALLLDNHPTGIIIDCSALTKVTSKGAETFADAFNYITSRNARIIVAGLSAELIEIGKTVPGVRSQLPLANSVEEARASLELEEISPERGKARLTAVVPILGNWGRAVQHAGKLAMGESCEIHLVDLIKVPRSLPLGTPQPEREAAGQVCIETGREMVRGAGLKCFSHVERVRAYPEGLIDFSHELGADFTVVSLDRPDREAPYIDELMALSLWESADFEVSLIKGMPDVSAVMPSRAVVPAVGAWQHALEHACKLVMGEKGQIDVVCLLEVPRSEALDVDNPDYDAVASDCAGDAARIGKRYGVKVKPHIERVRDSVLAFMKMMDLGDYDLAVVGVMRETMGDYHIARAICDALLNDAPCEVSLLRTGE